MKKVFFAVLLLSSLTMNAQEVMEIQEVEDQKVTNEFKADQGKIMAEIGFSPISATIDDVNLIGGQLRGVYVASDKIKIRLGLGFGIHKEEQERGVGEDWSKETLGVSLVTINPGFSYSFSGTSKLEPYIGLEVGFGTSASKHEYEYMVQGEKTSESYTNYYDTGINLFSVSGLTGFNYYFAKNIFIGTELGLAFVVNVHKDSYAEIKTEEMTNKKDLDKKAHTFDFYPTFVPTLRLGWAF